MKICHMTSAHKSTDVRIFKKQCVSLQKNGFDVYLVATGTNRTENGVTVIGVGNQHTRILRMFVDTYKVYKAAIKINADIYQIHDPELLPYALKLKKKGRKVIFDSHEDVISSIKEKDYIPVFLRNIVCKLYELYQNRVLKKIDAIISVTPHLVNKLKEINLNTIMVTNYPILKDLEKVINSKVYDLCFAGGISEQWLHHNILKAIKEIDNCQYVLCGSISESYLKELKSIESWNHVDYKGIVAYEDMENIYAQSKIGIALLDYVLNANGKIGTLGNTKLFEFMQAGLPVICTDFTLWKEIIDKYKCGICVNPHSIEDIKNAIIYIRNNAEEAKKMGENGKKAIKEEFNWNIQEKELLRLYMDLTKKIEE